MPLLKPFQEARVNAHSPSQAMTWSTAHASAASMPEGQGFSASFLGGLARELFRGQSRRVGNRGADLPQQLAAGRRPQPQATISIAKGCKRDGDACDRGGSADCASSGLAVRAGARSLALCRLAGFRHRAGKHGIAKHGGGAPARARPPDLYSRGNDGGGALRIDYVQKNSCARARAHARNATISDPRPLSLTDPDKCRRAEWQSCRKRSGAAHRNARSSDSSEPRVPMVPLSHALRNVRASGA